MLCPRTFTFKTSYNVQLAKVWGVCGPNNAHGRCTGTVSPKTSFSGMCSNQEADEYSLFSTTDSFCSVSASKRTLPNLLCLPPAPPPPWTLSWPQWNEKGKTLFFQQEVWAQGFSAHFEDLPLGKLVLAYISPVITKMPFYSYSLQYWILLFFLITATPLGKNM